MVPSLPLPGAGGGLEYSCVLAAHLSDLLYLGTSLPNERPALAGGDDQPQGDGRLGADGAVGHQCGEVLIWEIWERGLSRRGERPRGRD